MNSLLIYKYYYWFHSFSIFYSSNYFSLGFFLLLAIDFSNAATSAVSTLEKGISTNKQSRLAAMIVIETSPKNN